MYLAYPFCAQKCTYCNFASGVFPRALEPRYLEALQAELRAHPWQWIPETVYFGGGTPSQMDPADLARLLAPIPGHPWREATLEAAPGTITSEKARAWAAAGIDRVSLGVQSFVETEIRKTGRKHAAQTVADDIHTLASAGITNYNVDLIAGLAAQTESSWRESLDWIERLSPPHVSVYMLEVDDDSRLGREKLLGGVRYFASETPSDDQTADFYELAAERLASLGIERYEISNFARPGFESRHNLKYWTLEPYAGFGADAHSFDGAARTQNPETIESYLALLDPTTAERANPSFIQPAPAADIANPSFVQPASAIDIANPSFAQPTSAIDKANPPFAPTASAIDRPNPPSAQLAPASDRPNPSFAQLPSTIERANSSFAQPPSALEEPNPPSVQTASATDRPNPPSAQPALVGRAFRPAAGLPPGASAEGAGPLAEERLFLGLRLTRGIRPTPSDWARFSQPIRRFLAAGLLETDGGLLRLTPRGIMLSNEVFQEFLAA